MSSDQAHVRQLEEELLFFKNRLQTVEAMYEKKIKDMWEKWYQQELKSRKRFQDSVIAMIDESKKHIEDRLIAMTEESKQLMQKQHDRELKLVDRKNQDLREEVIKLRESKQLMQKQHDRETDAYESELKLVDRKNQDLREEVIKLRAERETGNVAIPRPLTAYDDQKEFWYINLFISQYEEGLRGIYGVQY